MKNKLILSKQYAIKQHKGQHRKNNKTPYWHHLRDVVNNLEMMGITDNHLTKLHSELMKLYDLPISVPNIDEEEIINSIKFDKKVRDGKVRWVLLKKISSPYINNNVDEKILREALKISR